MWFMCKNQTKPAPISYPNKKSKKIFGKGKWKRNKKIVRKKIKISVWIWTRIWLVNLVRLSFNEDNQSYLLMACLEVKKTRGSRVKGMRVIKLPYLEVF